MFRVVIRQPLPFEAFERKSFKEEEDARNYILEYVQGRRHVKMTDRCWRLFDTDLPTYVEIVKY